MTKIILIVFLAFSLLSCSQEENIKTDDSRTYEIITIDGMTCIRWIGSSKGGLTCNWDEWEGNK